MDKQKLKRRKNRLEAYDNLIRLKNKKVIRKEIIDQIHETYGIPIGALYAWYSGTQIPFGRKGRLSHKPALFYVLGALLGDGCLYKYRESCNYVIVVGDQRFANKYARKVSVCTNK